MEVQGSLYPNAAVISAITDVTQYDAQASQLDKPEKIQLLSKLFIEATRTALTPEKGCSYIAKVVSRYGKVLYDKAERDVARRAYSMALLLLAFPKKPRAPLPARLEDVGISATMADDCERLLLRTDAASLQQQIRDCSVEDTFEVASALRWLEHCHQNLPAYQTADHNDLFQATIGLARTRRAIISVKSARSSSSGSGQF